MEMDTPRTLLSMSLKHGNPVKTARRSTRKGPTLRQQATDDTGSEERSDASTAVNPVDVSSKDLEVETPRALISDALLTHNIQKTVRVPLQRVHPRSLKRSNENAHKEKGEADISPVKISVPDSSSHAEKENSAVREIQSHDKSADDEDHIALITSSEDETADLGRKEKVKRLRLSEVDIRKIPESTDLEAFSDDLLVKVKALLKARENREHVSEKGANQRNLLEPKLSSTRNGSVLDASLLSANQKKKTPRKDASTNTISFYSKNVESKTHQIKLSKESLSPKVSHQLEHNNEKELLNKDPKEVINNADEAIFASTVSEVSSEYGPLQLSRITEEGSLVLLGQDRKFNKTNETMHSTPFKNHEIIINNKSTETLHRQSRRFDPADDSDIWPDSLLEKEDKIHDPDPVIHVPESSLVLTLSQDIQGSKNNDVIPTKEKEAEVHLSKTSSKKASPAKISVKKQIIRRKRKNNGLPISRAQLSGIVHHYSSLRFSREALDEVEDLSVRYFSQTASYLEGICTTRKIKRILADDVTHLMERREHITSKKSLNVLVEENLPLEYREELIQVATAGNNVLP